MGLKEVIAEELPIELECFLLKYGFFERQHAPGRNAPVYIAEPKEEYVAWKPSFDGEEPTF